MKFIIVFLALGFSLRANADINFFEVISNESHHALSAWIPTDKSVPGEIQVNIVGVPGVNEDPPIMLAQIPNVVARINGSSDTRKRGEGFHLNLGPLGVIDLRFTGQKNECIVRSTLREFYVPKSEKFQDCTYGLMQPRPAFTGSN